MLLCSVSQLGQQLTTQYSAVPTFCIQPNTNRISVPGEHSKCSEMLFCKDEDEKYSDEGFILCTQEADKLHFLAHWAAGNGIPAELK